MRRVALLVFSLLIGSVTFAQNNISQAVAVSRSSENDSAKLKAYGYIFDHYLYLNPDSAAYFMQEGLNYFTKTNKKYGQARMLGYLATIDVNLSRLEVARRREIAALEIFKSLKAEREMASVYNMLGVIEGKNANFDSATKFFFMALKEFESLNDKKGLGTTYMKLGIVNEHTNNLDKALKYYNKALEAGQHVDPKNDLYLYNNIGIIYGRKGDYKTALQWFNTTLEKSNEPQFMGAHIMSLLNIGIAYDSMGRTDDALIYLNKALELTKNNNTPEDYVRVNISIADIVGKSDPQKALAPLKEGLNTSIKLGQKNLEIEVLASLIKAYKKLGNYKEALQSFEQQTALQDSVYSIERTKEVANLQSVYELDKSNARVNELISAEKRSTKKKNVIVAVAIFLLGGLLSILLLYRKTKGLNYKLSKRENELQKTNTVKDKLFSIIGHDLRGPIANIPAILELSNDPNISAEEKAYLLDSLKDHSVASLDTLDKLLYWGQLQIKGFGISKELIKAKENVQDILKLIKSNADQKHIAIDNKVADNIKVLVDPSHFDFVIRNLISNAIKFTNSGGAIEISADNDIQAGNVVFSVKDNGVGMDKEQLTHIFEPFGSSTLGTANERGTSIGLMLCKEFIHENGGKIWVESEPGKGTTFRFSLQHTS